MKGDFTRDTFRPWLAYEDVRLQQGRVHLDADWNERGDIHRFLRERSLTDVIGQSGVPLGPDGEPNENAFEAYIDTEGDGHLLIRPGRIWVEGILCRLEEVIDLGPPPPGRHAIYLEVWRRLVTAVEDPHIREVALGGPDTAVREQVVFKVRMDELEDEEQCADLLIPPVGETTGTMRAEAIPPADSDDPCPVPAQAGYTGLENRLYRVQIHHDGDTSDPIAPPTFKWSRANGSVLTEWLERDGRVLKVKSLGPDRVGGFHDAQWVELGHDELDFEAEQGPLVELEGPPVGADGDGLLTVVETDETLLFDPPLDLHAKVRRWDSGPVAITAGVPQDLESNIQVRFTEGYYRAGDYWLIPARAFIGEYQGSIEWPADDSDLPASIGPHGVDRRYARLAVLSPDVEGEPHLEDCRDTFPPLTDLGPGCCTVVVQPGDDVQEAINSLPDEGGCVCLKTGVHDVADAIRIGRSNVVLHGESPGAVVRRRSGPFLLAIEPDEANLVENVVVQGIGFEFELGDDVDTDELLLAGIDRAERVLIEDCRFATSVPVPILGVLVGGSRDVTIQRCRVETVWLGLWVATDTTRLTVRDCVFRGLESDGVDQGFTALQLEAVYGPATITGNDIAGFWLGVVLNRFLPVGEPSSGARDCLVAGNTISTRILRGESEEKGFLIDVAARSSVVRDNTLSYDAAIFGGIRLAGRDGRVENNTVVCTMEQVPAANPAVGIAVGYLGEQPDDDGLAAVVRANRILGAQDAIHVDQAAGVDVLDNRVESGAGFPLNGLLATRAADCRIAGNRFDETVHGIVLSGGRRNRILDNLMQSGGTGVWLTGETAPMLTGNRLDDLPGAGITGYLLYGTVTMTGNRVLNCSYVGRAAMGIGVALHLGELQIESCEVMNTGVSPDGETIVQPAFGIVGLYVLESRIQGNLVSYSNLDRRNVEAEDRALYLMGLMEYQLSDRIVFGWAAQVVDNKFSGTGASALIEFLEQPIGGLVARFERVVFNNNYCFHWTRLQQDEGVTVLLRGRSAIVMGNHIKSLGSGDSVRFGEVRGIFLGNDTQGGSDINFPANENQFNRP